VSISVLMIAFTNYPGDTRVRREAEALVARGDVVDVICPLTDAIGNQRVIGGVRLHPTGTLRQKGELSPLAYIARDLAFVARATFKALRLHRKHRCDVVQVHTMPDYLVAAAVFPKLMGAKVLLDVHDLVPELYAAKFGVDESSMVIRLMKLVERRCVAMADHALAVHKPHRAALVRHGNPESAFTIVMNAPDPRFFTRRSSSPAPGDPFVLVYHGTISRRHGLETAIRAVDIARQTYDDVRLEIVGDGDDVDRLLSIVEQLDLEDVVRIQRGLVPIEELEPILDRATVGIVPIVDNSFTRYMLPVKLIEYVALGIPVICSRTSSIEAYFDDAMVSFFQPGDTSDLAAKIIELRSDEERRRRLVEHADSFLAEHSWSRERDRYYGVVDDLAEQARGATVARDAVGAVPTERTLG
jgi:glycosyltransferase involved in cell wall biosynthesis